MFLINNLYSIIQAVIQGVVEGVTEFLPISSTGHMILVGHFINFNGSFADFFDVVIQVGAILAIIVLYWEKIWKSFVDLYHSALYRISSSYRRKNTYGRSRGWGLRLWVNVMVAALPAAVIGLKLNDVIEKKLFKPIPVTLALVFGGILMIIIENRFRKNSHTDSIDNIKIGQALIIGCFQCMALWPGMSRSASTIMGAWIVGLSSVAAAEFSFFLAIPTLFGASLLKIMKLDIALTNLQIIQLAIGFIVSFVVALVVVDKFIHFLKKKPMRVFAVYRIFVGLVIITLFLSGVLK